MIEQTLRNIGVLTGDVCRSGYRVALGSASSNLRPNHSVAVWVNPNTPGAIDLPISL